MCASPGQEPPGPWAAQYTEISGRASLASQRSDPSLLPLFERRQAWQFQVLPLRHDGGDLVIATTEAALPRAMRFAGWAVASHCSFVIVPETELVERLGRAYPMPGGRNVLDATRLSA